MAKPTPNMVIDGVLSSPIMVFSWVAEPPVVESSSGPATLSKFGMGFNAPSTSNSHTSEDEREQFLDELDIVEPRTISQFVARLINSPPTRNKSGHKSNKQNSTKDAQSMDLLSIRPYLTPSKGVASLGGSS